MKKQLPGKNGAKSGFSMSRPHFSSILTLLTVLAWFGNAQAFSLRPGGGKSGSLCITASRPPVSSINLVTSSPTNAASVQYAVTFGAAVTGVTTSNFALATSAGISGASITSISGSDASYTVTVNTGMGDGTIGLNLANNTGILPADGMTAPFTGQVYTIDKTAPSVNTLYEYSSNVNYAAAVVGDVITLDFGTNEPIMEPATVTIGGHTVIPAHNGVNVYRATYTMTTSDVSGRVHFFVQFTDLAGNTSVLFNDLGAGDDVEFSSTAPYAKNVHFISNNVNNTLANISDKVILSFTAGGPIQTPVISIAGHSVTATNTGGNNYSANYTMTAADAAGNITFNAALTDASMVTTTITNVTTGANVVFNSTPTVTIIGSVSALSTVPGVPSASRQFKVSGYNLSAGISVQPPTGFEISSDNVNFSYIVTVGSGVVVPQTPVYVRLSAGDLSGTYKTDVLAYSNGSAAKNLPVSPGTVAVQLKALSLSAGVLSPAFKNTTTSYTATVANNITGITVTATNADGVATIRVNGAAVVSQMPSSMLPLLVGPNKITVFETSMDSTLTKTYTVTVTRLPSSNDNLSALHISSGTLSPTFAGAVTTSYTASVPNAVSSITLTPTTAQNTSTVKINGVAVTSGSASGAISLNEGAANPINVVVTAQDGVTTKTYTVTVTRAPSTDASLANFAVNSGTLTPVFATGTANYTATVSSGTGNIKVTPTATDANATIMVNGTVVTSGIPSANIPLNVGYDTITTVVTAQDGIASRTYTLTVLRPSANANLSGLHLSNGAVLSPAFAGVGTTSYTASVGNAVSSITVTPTTAQPTSTVKVNGAAVTSGTASGAITLNVGSNTINAVVTAQDGVTIKTYTVTVTRSGPINIPDVAMVNNNLDHPSLDDDVIIVHQGLSPNGDGVNDFLQIDGILAYPDNKLTIISRNGTPVFEARNYDNQNKVFNGHSNKTGAMQQPGTYFYSLEYTIKGVTKHKTGFIVLKY